MMTTTTTTITETPFETYLNQQGEEAWAATLTTLLRSIHDVDKNATQIWFSFYPLSLFQALESAPDPDKLAAQLLMQGVFRLKDQIDSSHTFLYGHRYWPQVKKAVETFTENYDGAGNVQLSDQILELARQIAAAVKVDLSLLAGITAVAFMTIQQAGLAAFKNAPGAMLLDKKHAKKSTDQILSERAKDDSQGLFGFLKTIDKKW